ncbi:aldo/keto reductase [Heliobacterium mobile]|nr:aldo/keto reductase [Heliobacterium mobile]
MIYKPLGKSGCLVPALGQGCMGIGGFFSQDISDDDRYIGALQRGYALGMTFVDTAEVYGDGHSEEVIGKSVKGIRDSIFIASKFSPENSSSRGVIDAAERSLQRLRTDYIDLYQIHWPNPLIPLEETLGAMVKLVQEGKVRFIGVSNFSLKELKEAHALLGDKLVSIQNEYNLFDRSIESTVLPFCVENDMTMIAYSPLDQGNLSSPSKKACLEEIAQHHDGTVAQVVLNWLVAKRNVVAIPKSSNIHHVEENAKALAFRLSDAEIRLIDDAFSGNQKRIPVKEIRVVQDGQGNRKAYCTLSEAIENKLGFVPSPADLAEDIASGEPIKPVRVRKTTSTEGGYAYDLLEGRIRYWAWVIANGETSAIPVLIRE